MQLTSRKPRSLSPTSRSRFASGKQLLRRFDKALQEQPLVRGAVVGLLLLPLTGEWIAALAGGVAAALSTLFPIAWIIPIGLLGYYQFVVQQREPLALAVIATLMIAAVILVRLSLKEQPDKLAKRLHAAAVVITNAPTKEKVKRRETAQERRKRGAGFVNPVKIVDDERSVDAAKWINAVHDEDGEVESVTVRYPVSFDTGDEKKTRGLERQISSTLGEPLISEWKYKEDYVTFHIERPLPLRVVYGELPTVEDGPETIPVGVVQRWVGGGHRVGRTSVVLWDLRHFPHGLVAGSTQSGKTSALRALSARMLARGWDLVACDGKGMDAYACLRGRQHVRSVEDTPISIADAIENVHADVEARAQRIRSARRKGRPQPELPRLVLLVDEYIRFLGRLDEDVRERTIGFLTEIARSGAETNVTLLLAAQRPELPDDEIDPLYELRLNLGMRLSFGTLTPEAAALTFDDPSVSEAHRVVRPPPGRALLRLGTLYAETQIPWLPDPNTSEGSLEEISEAQSHLPPRHQEGSSRQFTTGSGFLNDTPTAARERTGKEQ